MSHRTVFSIALLALAGAGWLPVAAADSAKASCEARERGDLRKNASGPCSFSQHQGTVYIDLRNGESYVLHPANKANHYRDDRNAKVVRSFDGQDHVYQWPHKRITVRFSQADHTRSSGHIDHGGQVRNRCAEAVARKVGVSPNDVIVTNSTISEGTGRHVVYVGVPYGKADWICEADRNGRVVNVFYSGE